MLHAIAEYGAKRVHQMNAQPSQQANSLECLWALNMGQKHAVKQAARHMMHTKISDRTHWEGLWAYAGHLYEVACGRPRPLRLDVRRRNLHNSSSSI
jgi:hypothetical protein